jgi:hypothetical protein
MGQSKEHYNPKPMAANSSVNCGVSLGGFLCTVAGTLTVTDADGTVLVNALPVAVGPFIRIPLLFNSSAGGKVTLAGGAAGTLFT